MVECIKWGTGVAGNYAAGVMDNRGTSTAGNYAAGVVVNWKTGINGDWAAGVAVTEEPDASGNCSTEHVLKDNWGNSRFWK